jgi:hypothetical protein
MTLLMGWQYGDPTTNPPIPAYDQEGNLKAVNDVTLGISPPSNRVFGYDPDRYFLTSSTGPYGSGFASQTLSWLYDKNGNRTSETRGGVTTTYTYENDGSGHSNGVIASLSPGGTVNHLNSGDLDTDEQGVQYNYDALGRLTQAQSTSGCDPAAKNVLKRDAVGHRVIREVYPCNSGLLKTEYFVYGSDGNLYYREAWSGSDSLIEREAYVYLEGEPVAILRTFGSPTGSFFLHNDHLGRPLAMSNVVGSIVWKREFEPFGKSLGARLNTAFEPGFRFPGQWEYSDSGDVTGDTSIPGKINALEDNWNRTYAQRFGRYTQPDPSPVGGMPLQNLLESYGFLYALDSPVTQVDPLGLQAVLADPRLTPPNPEVMWGVECISTCLAVPVVITSGFRTKEENDRLKGAARRSQHLFGTAADIRRPRGIPENQVRDVADACGFFVLSTRYGDGHVHVDLRGGRLPVGPLPLPDRRRFPSGAVACLCRID